MKYTTEDKFPANTISQTLFPDLLDLDIIDINQDTNCADCLFPVCFANDYEVLNELGQKIYHLKEKSGCCERIFCYNCRGFNLTINKTITVNNNSNISLEGEKDCKLDYFECFGCGKPSISINVKYPKDSFLGKVSVNWNSCCFPKCSTRIEIFNSNNQLKYVIKANSCCCNIGICYNHLPKCCDILYNIYQNKEIIGKIEKLCCSNYRIFCTKGDKYRIYFPPIATPEEKMLLIIGCLLIDYQSFYL